MVTIETSMGAITLDLFENEAPITTANFVSYAQAGFYDGTDGNGATTFHRVIKDFMIQGGGLTEDLVTKSTLDPIVNESDNGKSNTRGTISMARTSDPNSATSQFFINTVDNAQLDINGSYPPGYAVFGEVISGMEVVDAIEMVETGSNDVPLKTVTITSVTVIQ
jgi:cyclophilin family peptidyl-prolyl cis-trans isomerase